MFWPEPARGPVLSSAALPCFLKATCPKCPADTLTLSLDTPNAWAFKEAASVQSRRYWLPLFLVL